MNFLKKLFGKKEEKEEIVEEEKPEVFYEETDKVCEWCKMSIYKEQKTKKFDGNHYHLKPCYRQLRKEARRNIMGS